jgi:hypothetical protein
MMQVASIALERYLLFREPYEYAADAARCFLASGAIHGPAPATRKRLLPLAGELRAFG